MIEFWIGFIIVIGFYITVSILIVNGIRSRLSTRNRIIRLILISLLYTLLFGIGIVGYDGGEPGFALPVPVFLAIIGVFITKTQHYYKAAIIPLAFWWVLIFTIMLIKLHVQQNKLKKNGA